VCNCLILTARVDAIAEGGDENSPAFYARIDLFRRQVFLLYSPELLGFR